MWNHYSIQGKILLRMLDGNWDEKLTKNFFQEYEATFFELLTLSVLNIRIPNLFKGKNFDWKCYKYSDKTVLSCCHWTFLFERSLTLYDSRGMVQIAISLRIQSYTVTMKEIDEKYKTQFIKTSKMSSFLIFYI